MKYTSIAFINSLIHLYNYLKWFYMTIKYKNELNDIKIIEEKIKELNEHSIRFVSSKYTQIFIDEKSEDIIDRYWQFYYSDTYAMELLNNSYSRISYILENGLEKYNQKLLISYESLFKTIQGILPNDVINDFKIDLRDMKIKSLIN